MGIRNIEKAPNLAREIAWGGSANADYEKGPDLRYGDPLQGLSSTGTVVNMISVNYSGKAELAAAAELGTPTLGGVTVNLNRLYQGRLPGATAATAANYGVFAVIEQAGVIQSVKAFHETAGDDSGDVTLDVEKLTGTQAPGGGVSVLGTTKIDLKAAANTQQAPALTGTAANKAVAVGNRLALLLTGVPTTAAGVVVSVVISPA